MTTLVGCSQDNSDNEKPTDTLIEAGVYDANETVIGPGNQFEYRPLKAVYHDQLRREWISHFPRSWRAAEEEIPIYLRPQEGKRIAAVVLEGTNIKDTEAPFPPATVTRFGVHEERDNSDKVWVNKHEQTFRPPEGRDLPTFESILMNNAAPLDNATHGLPESGPAAYEPIQPGESVIGYFTTEIPHEVDVTAFSTALGESKYEDGKEITLFPARWDMEFEPGEYTDS